MRYQPVALLMVSLALSAQSSPEPEQRTIVALRSSADGLPRLAADDRVWAQPLASGVAASVSLPTVSRSTLFFGDFSFRIEVPAGSTSLDIHLTDIRSIGDLDMYARYGADVGLSAGRPVADHLSDGVFTEEERIVIGTGSVPPLRVGTYFIAFALFPFLGPASATATIRATVTAGQLALSASELSFSAFQGGPAPPAQALTISSSPAGPLNWTATAATTSGGSWLSLSQTSGSGETRVNVTANPTGLGIGTYRGAITVTASGLGGSPRTVPVTLNVAARPVLAVGVSTLSFTGLPGQDPPAQSVPISNTGGGMMEWTATASTSSGGNWLVVSPAAGAGNATLQVSARTLGLAGPYTGTITITAPGATNSPATITVNLTVGLPVLLSSEGIVNAASFVRNRPLAVNQIVSFFGENLTDPCSLTPGAANACPSARGFPLPTQLGSTRVTFNGTPAPLLLATPGQINLLTPFGLTGTTATVVVTRGAVSGAPVTLPLAEQSLGIFTVLSSGAGAGIILHADGRLVTRDAPIETDEVLILFGTGMGGVSPAIGTGQATPGSPLAETLVPMRVFFDGGEGRILFSGPAPGFAGLYQINVRAPSFLARRYPVVRVQSAVSIANDVSAGGPGILDISPNTARAGADLTVTLRGVNFPPQSVLRIAGQDVAAVLREGPLQTLTATIPGRLLTQAGEVAVTVADPTAPEEAPSNAVRVRVQ